MDYIDHIPKSIWKERQLNADVRFIQTWLLIVLNIGIYLGFLVPIALDYFI